MQIVVRSLQNTFTVSLSEGASLKDLKAAIEDREFIPSGLQRIVKDSEDLTSKIFSLVVRISFPQCSPQIDGCLDNVLADMDTVTLLMGVDGGMRAKWRKKRMRRLRRKRRKMRMRAK